MIGDSKLAHSTTVLTVANSVFDFNAPPAEPRDLHFKTRAMRKRKAADSGLRGVELVGALHTLIELRNVLLRERRRGVAKGRAVKKEQERPTKGLQRNLFSGRWETLSQRWRRRWKDPQVTLQPSRANIRSRMRVHLLL